MQSGEAEIRAAFEDGRVIGTFEVGSAADCPYDYQCEPELRAAWFEGFSEARRSRRAA
ncbi:hypothetical protein [Sphingomonas lenta]|uniref:hypothetical protein n=1 Tax=Sphingomonas lenta TaxID=1141887 RepID=UPI0015953D67|nr:hypothetical protein [Sphingomonas lenta]